MDGFGFLSGKLSRVWRFTVVLVVVSAVVLTSLLPIEVAHALPAPLSVSVSPPFQSAPQGTRAMFTVSFIHGLAGTTYAFYASGLSYGARYYFSPKTVTGGSGSSMLVIGTSSLPGLYCQGVYPFTVGVTNTGVPPFTTASASATLTVTLAGPPLAVSVFTDKASYVKGDKVTFHVTVNRPAEGTITVTPPTGPSGTFSFQTYSATTLTKTLTASRPYGAYSVTVTADDYCSTYATASTTYSVGSNTYSVSIQLSVPQQYSSNLTVDGQNRGTISGSQVKVLSFLIGTTHTIVVGQYVPGGTGVRYYCTQNTLSVSSAGSLTFTYQPQYEFTLGTNPTGITEVSGGGWFAAGTTVQTGQAPQIVAGSPGTLYVFTGWQINGVTQSRNPVSLTLHGPYTAIAQYTTQYQLIVDSEYGNPQGAGYYNAGSAAQFSVTTPSGFPIEQIFVGWQGDYTGTSPQGSIIMNKPHVVGAVWSTSYIPLMAIILAAAAIVGALLFWRSRRSPPSETTAAPTSTPNRER